MQKIIFLLLATNLISAAHAGLRCERVISEKYPHLNVKEICKDVGSLCFQQNLYFKEALKVAEICRGVDDDCFERNMERYRGPVSTANACKIN